MSRGQLRIYMGAAPGVGKTFAMLNEGWRRKERGTDVVAGFVETHGRPNTAAAIRDLDVVPRKTMEYRGATFEEMDVDAVLARQPEVALVDELAHTNVPGSRNEKRWGDIEELLAAGIDVISTVNIQHLESLNDVVQRITGVVQRETVPDAVVRAADQIELVDMSPEALRRRMAHGNIYKAEKVDAALGHYFRAGNLGALRELALLWVADRVEEGLQDYRERHNLLEPWETKERVVVAITGAPGGERLIRRGARIAARSRAELVGVHVRSADGLAGPSPDLLDRRRELLDELGGRYAEISGNDPADALVRFARAENATQLLLGSSHRSRWSELARGSVINDVIRAAGPIDVHVISDGVVGNEGEDDYRGRSPASAKAPSTGSPGPWRPGEPARSGASTRSASGSAPGAGKPGPDRYASATGPALSPRLLDRLPRRRTPERQRGPRPRPVRWTATAWLLTLVGVPLATAAVFPARDTLGIGGSLLVLLLLPIGVALLGGMRPALVAAVVGFTLADFYYVPPTHSIRFARASDSIVLMVFVLVAAIVSALVDRLTRRTTQLAQGQVEVEAMAKLASGTALLDEAALDRLVHELRVTLDLDAVAVLSPEEPGSNGDGWRTDAIAGAPKPAAPDDGNYSAELSDGSILVVSGRPLAAEDRRLLDAFISQLRVAQSTLRLQAEAASATVLAEANNVRNAILAAVSHDLRAPLANIKAAATSVLSDEVDWPAEAVTGFCTTIDAEVDRLNAVVSNLLDMGRLQAGMLGVHLQAVAVEEVVYAALASLSEDSSAVEVAIAEGLPAAELDPVLFERVLANLISNALNWAPPDTPVLVEAAEVADHIDVRVVDRGAGIPLDHRDLVFQPFQRLGDGGDRHDGLGLGLAVTKGFVDAMDAEITVEDTPGGGTTMVVTLAKAKVVSP
jgi:two-component system, OmpR family, sensor histidine kinase KdpD